jgi:hypothetical protein
VSHATNVVEHPELVAERIARFANLVGKERVIASTIAVSAAACTRRSRGRSSRRWPRRRARDAAALALAKS